MPAWGILLPKAKSQGIAPLIYWQLCKSGKFSALPEFARNNLRSAYFTTWMHNKRLFDELRKLVSLFEQAGIPVILLKGACFALTIYPDLGLRPMGDLDILVPAPNMTEAVQIARQLGYVDAVLDPQSAINDLLANHVCLKKATAPDCVLEIHHTLIATESFTFAVPVNWFWEQTEPLAFSLLSGFEYAHILSPNAQLLYAAAHAMLQHGGKDVPLRWIYDIDLLIRVYKDRIDWNLLFDQSRKFEWSSALAAALSAATESFATPLPEHILASLASVSDRHTKLVDDLYILPATRTLVEYQKLITLSYSARFHLLLALIAPSPEYMRNRYGYKKSWQLPFLYLFRWMQIIKDGILTLGHIALSRWDAMIKF